MEKKCDVCGTAFETRTRAANRERFCSKVCYRQYSNAVLRAKKRVEIDLNRVCVVCSKHFVTDRSHPKALTCSSECSQIRVNKERSEKRTAIRDVAPRNCSLCGTEFFPNKFAPNKKYCSERCSGLVASRAYYARTPKAENTQRAQKYRAGGNWIKAMEQGNRKCEICGATEKLHVHHRDGTGEDEVANHQTENLVILCNSCHSQVHRIKYRIIDGQVYVLGLVFDWLGVTDVKVLKENG